MQFSNMTFDQLLAPGGHTCTCGRDHRTDLQYLKVGAGAVAFLPEALARLNASKPFIVCDENTYQAAWAFVGPVLAAASIPYVLHTLPGKALEPDEHTVGSILMAFDPTCDVVLAIGSGVINDSCKVLAHATGRRSMVVATAPSMDGYASNSSSMIQNRVKVTLYNACPAAILADTDIVKNAPMRMLWAGLGDMLAKYISICEWRMAHIVIDEYYCENVAGLVRQSLKKCVDAAPGLLERREDAIAAIIEGLLLSGIAMSFAQVSRPASGLEHYFSHIWEMMALDRGQHSDLHGIQVGIGTYLTFRMYDRELKGLKPDRSKAEAFIAAFDNAAWEKEMRAIFGKAAETIITSEHTKLHKNDPDRHRARLERTLARWDEIQEAIAQELPPTEEIAALMRSVGMPMEPSDIGIGREDVYAALIGSRDIRDKYMSCSLLWDLGLLHEVKLPV